MPHYIAFLRAINVGGHTVKMDVLRRQFEALDFSNPEKTLGRPSTIRGVNTIRKMAAKYTATVLPAAS